MKIGVLSDTHLTGTTEEFRKVLARCFSDADIVIHAGDMASIAVYDYLLNWPLRAVRGNMDDYDLANILPEKRIESVAGRKIGVIHGWGSPKNIEDAVFGAFTDVDIIIFGHSHIPLKTMKKGVLMFNPGSYRGSSSYRGTVGVIDLGGETVFRHIEV